MALTYPEAIVIGALQGVAELFPVSSLGHSILIPAIIGGQWASDLDITAKDSPYLAFVVALHVATAIALLIFFWRDWVRIIGGFFTSIRYRRMESSDERLAWLIIFGTIPVGIAGVALDHAMRSALGKPNPTAVFLALNGLVLLAAERLRRKASRVEDQAVAASVGHTDSELAAESDSRLARLDLKSGTLVGAAQILALFPGISRSGATMVAGLVRGLSHEDAARFAFLLATPVILAAGVLKAPELLGHEAKGIQGQILLGSLLSGVGAYISVRFLTKYFETRTLTPFAIYCMIAGIGSLIYLNV